MSGLYCETCKFFSAAALNVDWGECNDPSKRIYAKNGDSVNDAPEVSKEFSCLNYKPKEGQ